MFDLSQQMDSPDYIKNRQATPFITTILKHAHLQKLVKCLRFLAVRMTQTSLCTYAQFIQ